MIALVDYGAGNVRSVARAFAAVGAPVTLTSDPEAIRAADRVVFPGQGHFGQAMAQLRSTGIDEALRDVVARGAPFLGVCLGLQLLFEGSDEAPGVAGLGLLAGRCRRFEPPLKVPQIGWNGVRVATPGSPLDAVCAPEAWLYFVHSYHAVATEPDDVAGVADYGGDFVAAVRRGALFATQCHPEKSGRVGLDLLRAWLEVA